MYENIDTGAVGACDFVLTHAIRTIKTQARLHLVADSISYPSTALQFAGAWPIFLLNLFRLYYNLLGGREMCWGIFCATQPCANSSRVIANSGNLLVVTATSTLIFMVREPHAPWCVASLIVYHRQIVFLSWGEGKCAGACAVQASHAQTIPE